ncbi:unnamed protein product [Lactuca saligna]|uniref:GTP cyclohydrolase 1 n=1 Tax=Lactuca saligna TaxID=75948 RepID=A0AA36EA48_LACSI|nr:unnamed protein product [Lactuca saligna]
MGALDEGHYNAVLENGVKLGGCGFEQEPETVAIEDAVKVLLQGLGEDINREGLRKTPLRVAKALREGTRGYKQNVKDIVQGALFPELGLETGIGHAGGAGGLVLVRDLDLYSYSDIFTKRLQDPQRLADEICNGLQHEINPTGVAVVLHCSHIRFPDSHSAFLDSNQKRWVDVIVNSGSGSFGKPDSANWIDFFGLLRRRDITLDNMHSRTTNKDSWCPSRVKTGPGVSPMDTAVTSIIRSLGQDPGRKELTGTPTRFVKWLSNFKDSKLEMKINGLGFGPLTTTSPTNCKIRSELNLSLWSLCEHHLLPFYGSVHIGYVSSEEVSPILKSILQSVVHFHGFKLQVQERLTRQIAETVSRLLGGNIIVVVEANHTCMISRGIEKFGSNTGTIAVLGRFSHDPAARAEFLELIPESL